MNQPPQSGFTDLLGYPLIAALTHRRSRRFALGAVLNGGGLAFRSTKKPVPLTALEEAILATGATGFNGMALAELPYDEGDQPRAGGGNVMAAFTGRCGASADAIHATTLFVINDEGTYLLKRPQDYMADELPELLDLLRERQYVSLYDRSRVLIRQGRTNVLRFVPHVLPFNIW